MKKPFAFSPAWALLLVLLPLGAGLFSVCVGRIAISPTDVWKVFWGKASGQMLVSDITARTILNIRLPRVVLAMLAGAGLSVAGCTFQALFANPLATPDTLGAASGAGFGAALGILLGFSSSGVQALSFGFGMAAVTLTWLCGMGKSRPLSAAILSGVMVGSLFSALISLVKFAADPEDQLPAISYWLMGSLSGVGFARIRLGAAVICPCMAGLGLLRWRLNLLPLPEGEIHAFGVNVRLLRAVSVLCATAITAACVCLCGQVGWVGLLVPHMCRMKFGCDHRRLIPACVSLGAAFLVLVDTAARSVSAADLPISILTALIGAPFFIFLMQKTGGWQF